MGPALLLASLSALAGQGKQDGVRVAWRPARPLQGSLVLVGVRAAQVDSVHAIEGKLAGEPLHFELIDGWFRAIGAVPLDAGANTQARLVIVSGGIPPRGFQLKPESEMLRDALIQAGVPVERIVQDPGARTTREHPQTLGSIFERYHVRQFVLVTSPAHMRRALSVFHAAGLDPVPSVSPLRSENRPQPPWLVPTQTSLDQSDQAVYEYAAWVYYIANGWN